MKFLPRRPQDRDEQEQTAKLYISSSETGELFYLTGKILMASLGFVAQAQKELKLAKDCQYGPTSAFIAVADMQFLFNITKINICRCVERNIGKVYVFIFRCVEKGKAVCRMSVLKFLVWVQQCILLYKSNMGHIHLFNSLNLYVKEHYFAFCVIYIF